MDIWVRSVINIYIADYNNQRIQRFDRNMNFISILRRNVGVAEEFSFYEVSSVALNGQKELFLIEHDENKIVKFDRNGNPERIFGTLESGEGELIKPQQIDILPNGQLVISDINRQSILFYDPFGSFIKEIVSPDFLSPKGLGVSADGNIYVADPAAGKVFIISPGSGNIKSLVLRGGKKLLQPKDVALYRKPDGKTNIYILDDNQVIIGLMTDLQE